MSERPLFTDETSKKQFTQQLISLSDDFSDFSNECSFVCDAFAAIAREPECITEETSEGFRHVSYRLKCQVREFYRQIEALYQALDAELSAADDKPS